MFELEIFAIEAVSAIACFILVKFMATPFLLTREKRYLGLPLGFGFLGASYIFTAFSHISIIDFSGKWWIQLFFRATSFLFLLITYLLSETINKRNKLWTTTIGALIAILAFLILLPSFSPQTLGPEYNTTQIYVRVFNSICILFIIGHILKSHIVQPQDPTTLIFPFGYISLEIGQLLQIIWAVDNSLLAFWMGIAFRLIGFAIFLFISFRIFYSSENGGPNEKN